MIVGVIGAGGVGTALGGRLQASKHTVIYGSRDPKSAKLEQVLASQPGARADTISGTVSASDVIILATPGVRTKAQTAEVAASLGPGISGKVLIDATNPLTAYPQLEVLWDGTSAGELLQEVLPSTYVYKAFNTVGVELLGNPLVGDTALTMLVAGPSEKLGTVSQVVAGVGFIPKFVGPIRYARNLEALAELWIHLGVPGAGLGAEKWGRAFNFQVIP